MLFTFWAGAASVQPESVGAWRERYPDFAVFNDEDVAPLLDTDEQREIYQKIRIPACRSDVARLVLLREHGGLYLDAHMGPSSGDRLAETLSDLARYDLILFSWGWKSQFNFMNGVLAARRRAPVLDLLITKAFDNLVAHKRCEDATSEYIKYNIFNLTGTWVMVQCMFQNIGGTWDRKPEYKEKVRFHVMETGSSPGFQIYKFYGYRKPGEHWSERQLSERLFEP